MTQNLMARRLGEPSDLPVEPSPVSQALQEVVRRGNARNVTAVQRLPAREAVYAPFPADTDPRLVRAYGELGIQQLYSHQAEALARVAHGRNIVLVTPTASGKTLAYNLPVLNAILRNPDTRALYLFPTKALAQDQLHHLMSLIERVDADIRTFTYDGDTPADARKAIRQQGHIVITNPDMLHTGILPHHTKWTRVFENLHYIVIDELHTYRGVFGSHLTNLLRRLKRIARFYGSQPRFICSSATIANPGELAQALLEDGVDVIAATGAPSAEKWFLFYNPPVVNRLLGIRRSYVNEAAQVALIFLDRNLQTIVFANSRLITEVLVTYLKQSRAGLPLPDNSVRGYRGGYLPLERRAIERGLRDGSIRAVVSTNALELGIDIGSLEVAVLAGYPGTIASTWQRLGRAGRRSGVSAAVLVASSAPLDQFIVQNPDYFFGHSPEHGHVNPDNLELLVNHLKCAAFELPLREDELFGRIPVKPICELLAEREFLYPSAGVYHWTSEAYPADAISLRSISSDNFVIIDRTEGTRVIGEVDFPSALAIVHPQAIYIHEGQQYHVEELDYEQRKAYVRAVDVDYFTMAISYTNVKILERAERTAALPIEKSHGEVDVRTQVVGFKKIKFYTLENVGSGKLELPEQEMHTTAYWLTLPRAFLTELPYSTRHRQNGLIGLMHALAAVATLLLMCDRRDIGVTLGENSPDAPATVPGEGGEFFEPNIYIYDSYPGGIGFSRPLFEMHEDLLRGALRLIESCGCESGCPSCIGPMLESGELGKEVALEILRRIVRSQRVDR